MIMSSIKKGPLCPFDLLGLAIFVSANASALPILLWKVLVTQPCSLDITTESPEEIKRLSTDTLSDHTPWLLETALAYRYLPKILCTKYSAIQGNYPRCCFFSALTILIAGFFMTSTRKLFCYYHFLSAMALMVIFCVRIKPAFQYHRLRPTTLSIVTT
jgi:hypothetical protein